MNELEIFKNKEFGEIRTLCVNSEPWFVGKDLVEKLGYDLKTNRYTLYVNKFVDEEDRILINKKTGLQNTIEFNYKELGQRGGWIINESGMYSLILSSPLPSAKQFKRWVTSEVLPSIRKKQYYIHSDISEENIRKLEQEIIKQREKIKLLNGEIRQHKFFEKQITGAWITVNWDADTYRVGNIVMEMDFVKSFVSKYLNKYGMPKIDRESIQRIRIHSFKLEISKLCLQSILGAYATANINSVLK